MSKQHETGGPAFPVPEHLDERGNGHEQSIGMTLRDYFAAKVMPAIYEVAMIEAADGSGLFKDDDWRMGLAIDAYAMADAMLKAREFPHGD